MKIDLDLFGAQEPADYAIAVQMAWDMVPLFWRNLFPAEMTLFLLSSADLITALNPRISSSVAAIIVIAPSGTGDQQVLNASLFGICSALLATPKVQSVVYRVAEKMLEGLDFTPEERQDLENPQFIPQIFVQSLLSYVICVSGERLEDEFGRHFIQEVTEELEATERRAEAPFFLSKNTA